MNTTILTTGISGFRIIKPLPKHEMFEGEKVDELTKKASLAGYEVISGPRMTGDGYYESCIVTIEENLIELTV